MKNVLHANVLFRIGETTMTVFSWFALSSPHLSNWTGSNNETAESCVCTIYSAEYRVCTDITVAYVFIALLCLAILALIGVFVKYFLNRYFSSPRERNERPFLHIH